MDGFLRSRARGAPEIARALRFVWQSAPGWTVASGALIFAQSGLQLLVLVLMKLVVDVVTNALGSSGGAGAFGSVAVLVSAVAAVGLVLLGLEALSELVRDQQTHLLGDEMQERLLEKSAEIDLEFYENSQYYDALHRAQQEAPYRPARIVQGLLQVAQNGVSLVTLAALLATLHWGITLLLFAAVVPGVFVRIRFAGAIFSWQKNRTTAERRTNYLGSLLSGAGHAKEVRMLGLPSLLLGRFREVRAALRAERLALMKRETSAVFLAQGVATLLMLGAYLFITHRTLGGAITLGDMVMYFATFQRGLSCLRLMLTGLANLHEDNLFLSNLHAFLDLAPTVKSHKPGGKLPARLSSGVAFEHVAFRYPGTEITVLDDVSFAIRPGETVALVGQNGSGKSTLIKLLCRLYDPTSGRITIDGQDLRSFDLEALRRGVRVVFQDFARYHFTARENIWFGDLSAPCDADRIRAAAAISGADEFLSSLRAGYDSMLGREFETGTELSVGEWQKVALARGFFRDAPLLVLDEPTSALDAAAEHELLERIRGCLGECTTLLVSHRFRTTQLADRILVMGDGRILESGTHDELLEARGRYADLYEKQTRYHA